MTTIVCCVCDRAPLPESDDSQGATELRPYGPNGAPICFTCAMLPERVEETERQFNVVIDRCAEESLADGGTVAHIVLTEDGPRPLKAGRA